MARTAPLLPTLRPYLFATAASFLALVLASIAAPFVESAPLLAFLTAVALSAWYGGPGPGLLATAFGTAALGVFFAADVPSLALLSAETVLELLAFAAAATALSLLARKLRTALKDAAAAQEAAQDARDRLTVILDGIGDGVMVQDQTGRLVYVNETGAQASGYPSAEAMLQASNEAVIRQFTLVDEAGDPFPLDRLPGRVALGGGEAPETLIGHRRGDTGVTRWSVIKARPVCDAAGRITGEVSPLARTGCC